MAHNKIKALFDVWASVFREWGVYVSWGLKCTMERCPFEYVRILVYILKTSRKAWKYNSPQHFRFIIHQPVFSGDLIFQLGQKPFSGYNMYNPFLCKVLFNLGKRHVLPCFFVDKQRRLLQPVVVMEFNC